MFVLNKTFEKLQRKHDKLRSAYDKLLVDQFSLSITHEKLMREYNNLVKTINEKGGQKFLDNATVGSASINGIDADDIKKIILLCHPDKHDGKKIAIDITKKLLSIRNSVKI